MYEARYYKLVPDNKVQCLLCPQGCIIMEGKSGFCGVRENRGGKLYSAIYGEATAIALDPIEKKPLYHFHPGEMILSLGTKGCNLKCPFCQNWHISQTFGVHTSRITPEIAVSKAREAGSFGIAYTYNEPFIWYEFVFDTARLAREKGLCNVLVTNGFVNPAPLAEILPFIDAMSIDLKAMDEDFYKKICGGRLAPVLETIKKSTQSTHIELTNLIIPGLNDTDEHFQKLTGWIAANPGPDTPLHFSRYFPAFKLNRPATPLETLKRAEKIAKEKLKYVYLGNV